MYHIYIIFMMSTILLHNIYTNSPYIQYSLSRGVLVRSAGVYFGTACCDHDVSYVICFAKCLVTAAAIVKALYK